MSIPIEELILQTEASGAPVRLEYVRGELRWEASPPCATSIPLIQFAPPSKLQLEVGVAAITTVMC